MAWLTSFNQFLARYLNDGLFELGKVCIHSLGLPRSSVNQK
ncbi:hypothetical protein CSC30_2187 [Pseudomonas aeruginosa]|nr:hypothetical protein CSC30_2187 [Pseudomonas aeruginosa]AWZ87391.1 hypothetical protein CSC41_0064 [Pseudomonas aeruginosa]QJE76282.1 Uncharacterized protein PA52Ts1_1322 [Pseudomonas aeruginosa]